VSGHDDDRLPWYEATPSALSDVHPSHDRFTRARLIGEQEPQARLSEHVAEDGFVLMREGP
jgi:hypothetical protein